MLARPWASSVTQRSVAVTALSLWLLCFGRCAAREECSRVSCGECDGCGWWCLARAKECKTRQDKTGQDNPPARWIARQGLREEVIRNCYCYDAALHDGIKEFD